MTPRQMLVLQAAADVDVLREPDGMHGVCRSLVWPHQCLMPVAGGYRITPEGLSGLARSQARSPSNLLGADRAYEADND